MPEHCCEHVVVVVLKHALYPPKTSDSEFDSCGANFPESPDFCARPPNDVAVVGGDCANPCKFSKSAQQVPVNLFLLPLV